MSGIYIRTLRNDLPFGAIVEGVDWDTIADPDARARINATFEDRGMIVFKGVEPSAKMQAAISRIFGELKDHPTKTTARTDEDIAPGVIDMHHKPHPDPANGAGLVEKDGQRLARFSPWHFDHCYTDQLNRAGVLRAVVNAPEGGRTGFVDGVALYETFPRALRDRIEGLDILYTLDTRLSKMRFGVNFTPLGDLPEELELLKEAAKFPRALHPAVWTRATGEKVLHVGPWMAVGIAGHEDAEGDALMEAVCQEINRAPIVYWHDWSPTDMLIWDNWRMLHAVEGCDARYERRTQRTTIKGDYGFGSFEHGKRIGEVQREMA